MPNWGEGPGPITADGSPVAVYLRLPYRDELELLDGHIPSACSLLELGCGTGRLTRRLLEKGHAVTAVDNSPEMLRHVPEEALRICADIEHLRTGKTYDVVLLASNLVNVGEDSARRVLLQACRLHLSPGGLLLFQRFDPDWLRSVEPGPYPSIGEVAISVERAVRQGRFIDMSIRYAVGEMEWKQHFTAQLLDDEDVRLALAEAGFGDVRWIDKRWGAVAAVADVT